MTIIVSILYESLDISDAITRDTQQIINFRQESCVYSLCPAKLIS